MPSSTERFMRKIDKNPKSGCWVWIGSRTPTGGYGSFWDNGKLHRAHRWSYRHFHGEIGDNEDVCHACDNPPCVNPEHLFRGTRLDNIIDSVKKGRWGHPGHSNYINRTCSLFCGQGHRLSGDNVSIYKGKRYCKTCAKQRRVLSNAKRNLKNSKKEATHA